MAFRRSLLLLSIFSVRSYQSDCPANSPIVLPITDVALASGNSIRGALLTAGSPPQNLSWFPQMWLNNTWLFNSSSPYCPNGTSSQWCDTYRGGLYDPDKSSSAKAVADVYAAGASASDTDRTLGLHIWDSSWTLDDLGAGNITLDAFPIGMPGFDYGEQYHPQGAIGLGPNSTLLTALKDAGHISSRSYGYWWGEDGATSNAQMDGSIVLGGYDAAKVQGSNVTGALKTPSLSCMSGAHLTITDIIMQFPNSTRTSIIAPRSPLSACLQIDFPAMLSFPYDPYYKRFEDSSQAWSEFSSVGIDWWNPLYDPSFVYQGSLSVVLDNGMQFAIPNELLVVPEKIIDKSGKVQVNSSNAEVLIQPTLGINAADTPVIGKQFFSSTYLFVDHDAGTFTVWQANSTSDTRLVSVGGNCSATETQEIVPSSSSSSSSEAPLRTSDRPENAAESEQADTSLTTGAIAGIAVGGIAVLAALVGIILVCLARKKKERVQSEERWSADGAPQGDSKIPYSPLPTRHELPNAARSELYAFREVGELDGAMRKGGNMNQNGRPPTVAYELPARSP